MVQIFCLNVQVCEIESVQVKAQQYVKQSVFYLIFDYICILFNQFKNGLVVQWYISTDDV